MANVVKPQVHPMIANPRFLRGVRWFAYLALGVLVAGLAFG